jgi:hypothetical protein
MGYEDVRHALESMGDDNVRGRLAAGDFSCLQGVELTEDEQTLVRDAAGDMPDVEGFLLISGNLPAIMDSSPKLGAAMQYTKIENGLNFTDKWINY